MSFPARATKAMAKRRARPAQQFGQSSDVSTFAGATGCTHTVLQFLAYLWKNRWYTHDDISRYAGYPFPTYNIHRRGLRPSEVQAFCNRVGLPYVIRYRMTYLELLRASARGPVGFGHSYSYWPEWKGYHYGGRTADGSPNGYAKPLLHAGRTQLSGFSPPNDAHYGLLLGWDDDASALTARVAAWEPNHGSPSRPEKPPYDLMTTAQFRRVYDSYTKVLGRTPYALIPTRSLPL